jgi:hypothetical protein
MNIKIYCDESCHLISNNSKYMVLGAVFCDEILVKKVNSDIRKLKMKHFKTSYREIKWTTVSPAKIDFYLELIEYFIKNDALSFRGIIADTANLDHDEYNDGDPNSWYYKMFYFLLEPMLSTNNHYKIYLDYKDTNGGHNNRKLHEILNTKFRNTSTILRVKQIQSTESEIIQISDLIIGSLAYYNRFFKQNKSVEHRSEAKKKIIELLSSKYDFSKTSPRSNKKFNILNWQPRSK